ncbi:MAG: CRISPR-associated helicase Cas3' [Opitutales bacterium]|nr:CRISPR-associated helicase Cas3' [Opitutales bacterium]
MNTSLTTFADFFEATTDHPPYLWQCRLACGEPPEGANCDLSSPDKLTTQWLSGGNSCASRLIDIPTGLGKTAGVVLAWLWNRRQFDEESTWPRRLVYCLPMRTLVEQTEHEVMQWISKVAQAAYSTFQRPRVVILMGGEDLSPEAKDWDLHPEDPAILIGTQDMLLSRALNRGYGMSRYRWPMHFALLNNDALWVIDEVQLMGSGIQTARQLEAFRRSAKASTEPLGMGGHGPSFTWYCSATASAKVLTTREWRRLPFDDDWKIELSDAEKNATEGDVARRRLATKQLLSENSAKATDKVDAILNTHNTLVKTLDDEKAPIEIPRRTLVICNTVDRAKEVYEKLNSAVSAVNRDPQPEVILLHSRFRPLERANASAKLHSNYLQSLPRGQIVVSTQVIEAGVDISSGCLWTEIAPLSSLVQRMGRHNRAGEFGHKGNAIYKWKPTIYILGVGVKAAPTKESKKEKEERENKNRKCCLPYDFGACDAAWLALEKLNSDASPANLSTIHSEIADSIQPLPYSLLRHELLDFFDTDANLSLGFTDVSPFVRGLDEDTDVYVLWRDWERQTAPDKHYRGDIGRNELCSVPISKIKDFTNRRKGFLWLGKERGWVSATKIAPFPGSILLLPCEAGGYSDTLGWTGLESDQPSDLYQPAELPSDEDMLSILKSGWQSIDEHTQDVKKEWSAIANALLSSMDLEKQAGDEAVVWHDFGKNHPRWQQAVADACEAAQVTACEDKRPWGKFDLSESPNLKNDEGQLLTGKGLQIAIFQIKCLFRPGVLHEVASALALRQYHIDQKGVKRIWDEANQDDYLRHLLSEYLVMTHHGRVRKVLRDEIPIKPKCAKALTIVRGIQQGDHIPALHTCKVDLPETTLEIECRKMGRTDDGHESYTKGVLRLLEYYGPFRLAYLEMLLRAADARASKVAQAASLSSLNPGSEPF